MEDKLAQKNDFNINQIVMTITRTPGSEILYNKIEIIMLHFGTSVDEKMKIRWEKSQINFSICDALSTILCEFKQRMADKANISTIISKFRDCELNEVAEALEKEFLPQEFRTSSNDSGNEDLNVRWMKANKIKQNCSCNETEPLNGIQIFYKETESQIPAHNMHGKSWRCILLYILISILLAIAVFGLIGMLVFLVSSHKKNERVKRGNLREPTHLPFSSKTPQDVDSPASKLSPSKNILTSKLSNNAPYLETVQNREPYNNNFVDIKLENVTSMNPAIVNLTVKSYQDYKKDISASNATINLHITSFDSSSWENMGSLGDTHRVKYLNIEGSLLTDTLMHILNKMNSVIELSLTSSIGGFCRPDYFYNASLCNIQLPMVTQLTLFNFSKCYNVLETIASCFQMNQLKLLRFYGTIDDQNIIQLHEIFRKSSNTLETIFFSGVCDTQKGLFDYGAALQLLKIRSLVLDFRETCALSSWAGLRNETICDRMQALGSFEMTSGSIKYSQFVSVLQCQELINITANVTLASSNSDLILDLKELTRPPAFLQRMHVTINFSQCSHIASYSGTVKNIRQGTWMTSVKDFRLCIFCRHNTGFIQTCDE